MSQCTIAIQDFPIQCNCIPELKQIYVFPVNIFCSIRVLFFDAWNLFGVATTLKISLLFSWWFFLHKFQSMANDTPFQSICLALSHEMWMIILKLVETMYTLNVSSSWTWNTPHHCWGCGTRRYACDSWWSSYSQRWTSPHPCFSYQRQISSFPLGTGPSPIVWSCWWKTVRWPKPPWAGYGPPWTGTGQPRYHEER